MYLNFFFLFARYSKPNVNHKRKKNCILEKCDDNHPLKLLTTTMVCISVLV